MKITSVEAMVLKSEGLYKSPEGSEEPPGARRAGLTAWSDPAGASVPSLSVRRSANHAWLYS